MTVYARQNANPLKLDRTRALGASLFLAGDDFDAARSEARMASAACDARLVVDSLDIETVEGAGAIGLEFLRLPARLDMLLVAQGNGAMFNGIAGGMKAHTPETRVIAVGAQGAAAQW
ncbi:pyridoxal-phosphate dependent enzyme [Burkholderia sp. R-69927]|nr:pyridoxal-phosphate dependent enzyme [Burkholderia sp. R-69927]